MTTKHNDAHLNIGIYGGAFDPPHRAHVNLAEAALAQFKFDELHVIPTGDAVHKRRHLTPAVHRIAMAKLAFTGVAKTLIDEREVNRGGASYTIDTLLELRAVYPKAKFTVIVGQDQLMAFQTWHRYEEILKMATLAVVVRGGGSAATNATNAAAEAASPIPHTVITFAPHTISSSDIRQMIRMKETDAAFAAKMKPSVLSYIHEHALYLSNP
jgi:nicotinate-nucleotide adenylyltransferase